MKTIILLALLVLSWTAWATPGALDESGCHNSQKIGWHCHPQHGRAGGLPGGESQTQRDKRLKKECKGRPNGGACLGYAKP